MPHPAFTTSLAPENSMDAGILPQRKDGDQYASGDPKVSVCLIEWNGKRGTWDHLDTKIISESTKRAQDFEDCNQDEIFEDPRFVPGLDNGGDVMEKPNVHMFDLLYHSK